MLITHYWMLNIREYDSWHQSVSIPRHPSEGWKCFTTAAGLVIQVHIGSLKLDPSLRWDDEIERLVP